MVPEYIASTLLGSLLISLTVLFQVYLWQRKEYRWDRMRSYLLSQESSHIKDKLLWVFVAFVLAGWFSRFVVNEVAAEILGWFALVALTMKFAYTTYTKGIFRPTPTKKSIVTVFLAIVLVVAALWVAVMDTKILALAFATLIALLPVVLGLAVLGANAVAGIRKKMFIQKATRIRAGNTHLQVVAITGSVGKTTTKEYIAHMLRRAGKHVVATKAHRNSEFPVAQDVLEQLTPDVDTYVVEAAAYRAGEVAAIMNIVQPQFGVLTEITNQHVGLFGSLQALAQAKWEIVSHLPKDGVAILNIDNPEIAKRRADATQNVVTYSSKGEADVYVDDITIQKKDITATLHVGSEQKKVTLPIVGRGELSSALAATAAAHAMGVSFADITANLATLPSLAQTMHVTGGVEGSTVIDDSYSGSEASYINAFGHLKVFASSDARIALVPIIELGDSAPDVHENIGKQLAGLGAKVYIFGEAYKKDIMRGAGDAAANIHWFTNGKEMAQKITHGISNESVVLLEGRLPAEVRAAVLKK